MTWVTFGPPSSAKTGRWVTAVRGNRREVYLQKEGKEEDMDGRKCICNGLMAGVGLGQKQKGGYQEKPLVTSGDDLARIVTFLKGDKLSYSAQDVIQYLLGAFTVGLGPVTA